MAVKKAIGKALNLDNRIAEIFDAGMQYQLIFDKPSERHKISESDKIFLEKKLSHRGA